MAQMRRWQHDMGLGFRTVGISFFFLRFHVRGEKVGKGKHKVQQQRSRALVPN